MYWRAGVDRCPVRREAGENGPADWTVSSRSTARPRSRTPPSNVGPVRTRGRAVPRRACRRPRRSRPARPTARHGGTRGCRRSRLHAETDRPLLAECGLDVGALAAVLDGAPVIDAGMALQRRHEQQLGGLDRPADAYLAGRQRRDRRRARVPDPGRGPVAGHATDQEPQPSRDACGSQGECLRDDRDDAHVPIVARGPGRPMDAGDTFAIPAVPTAVC